MEIVLENRKIKVCLSTLGAAVRSIEVRLPDDTIRSIALCFAEEEIWNENPFYAGATLAPTAGRIRDGLLPIGPRTYRLTKNENGTTHLHGGFHNLSFCHWEVADYKPQHSVTFLAALPDGAEGYPGSRTFFVTYRLADSRLHILLDAKTDQPTYINMSNHAYFNLNGFQTSGLDQYLKIQADQVIINDGSHLPKGRIDTAGTEFDFAGFKHLGTMINHYKDGEQILLSRGYNHCFLFSSTAGTLRPTHALMSLDRKLSIDFYTDAPALVLYTGGFLDDSFLLAGGDTHFRSYPGCAIALEPCFPPCWESSPEGTGFFITENEFHREIRMDFSSNP